MKVEEQRLSEEKEQEKKGGQEIVGELHPGHPTPERPREWVPGRLEGVQREVGTGKGDSPSQSPLAQGR